MFHAMWKAAQKLDKYQYARTNPYLVKLIGVAGIFATLMMGYGLWQYLQLKTIYLLIFGPLAVVIIGNKLFRFVVQLFYQKFDIKKHERFVEQFWLTNREPSVDIFLPWAGENLEIHEQVVKAVSQLNYTNYKVYMLDDVGSLEHEQLAKKYGFTHLSRPNKGHYKKSGNLEYGYSHSHGKFVFILDADFVPIKEALEESIPYIVSDKSIGILQTPQYFEQTNDVHKNSKIEFGGGNIVEDFYRIIMPCRDEFKAAMCVGTSAIYRRTAIEKLEGTPKVHASEDLATGLLITQFGYYVKYLPLILSIGKSPDTYQAYFKQHLRWCSGNLVFIKFWPHAKLSLMARLIYLVNPMYYLSEALTILFSFQVLVLLYFHTDTLSVMHTLYFLPYVLLSRIVIPYHKANKNKVGTKLAALNNAYTYFYTYIRLIARNVPAWHPTGVKTTGISNDFLEAINIGTIISTIYILSFLAILLLKPSIWGNYNAYIVLGWGLYGIFWHTLYLSSVSDYIRSIKLQFAKSFTEKAAIHFRANLNYFLFFILVGIALFNTTMVSFDSQALTTIAIGKLNEQNTKKLSVIDQSIEERTISSVLGTKTIQPIIQPHYSFESDRTDTLLTLAESAIIQFALEQNITLSNSQIYYAAQALIEQGNYSQKIKVGEVMTFDTKLIINSINLALNIDIKGKNF